jgi:beta-lactamase regulating signal transducer with metallopeptidase domain
MAMTVVWTFTWLGQSAALAVLTAAFVRLPGCRASAAARCAAWSLALFLCAGLLAWPLASSAGSGPSVGPKPDLAGVPATGPVPVVVLPARAAQLSLWLGWLWALGAAAGLALVARDVSRVVRLKRRASPLAASERDRLCAGLSAGLSSRGLRLAWCDELDSPAVLGFARPVIALPRSQLSRLTDEQARLVVLHELAHVRRRDDWWVLAERIVLALTWVNPAVHWARRQIALSREMACDQSVVRQTAAPVAYAKCLADVAQLRSRTRRVRLAAAVTGWRGTLRRRIVGVLAFDHRPRSRAAGFVAWLAPAAVCVVAAGVMQLPPVVVVVQQPRAGAGAAAPVDPPIAAGSAAFAPPSAPAGSPRPSSPVPRTPAAQGTPAAPAAPVTPGAADEARLQPAARRAETAQADTVQEQPLAASPLPAVGAPGVTAPGIPETLLPQAEIEGHWWSAPAALGASAGSGTATAGRATASFIARIGSRVPQLFKR